MLQKRKILKILNFILFLLFIAQAGSGVAYGKIEQQLFEAIHRRTGYALIVVVMLHLALNRDWIKSNYFKN